MVSFVVAQPNQPERVPRPKKPDAFEGSAEITCQQVLTNGFPALAPKDSLWFYRCDMGYPQTSTNSFSADEHGTQPEMGSLKKHKPPRPGCCK